MSTSPSSSSARTFIHPQDQTHIVIDLETLAVTSDAVVISIGVAIGKGTAFHAIQWNLEASSQLLKGRVVDQSTLDWWNKQPAATQQLAVENCVSADTALLEFSNLISSYQNEGEEYISIWGNSPSFDLTILSSLFKAYGQKTPWKYWQERDLRTFGACVGVAYNDWNGDPMAPAVIPHYAKHDATHELRFILAHLDQLVR